jgi:hypothetical protein
MLLFTTKELKYVLFSRDWVYFLLAQIHTPMSVLLYIGQGLELPEVVMISLDIRAAIKGRRRPSCQVSFPSCSWISLSTGTFDWKHLSGHDGIVLLDEGSGTGVLAIKQHIQSSWTRICDRCPIRDQRRV